MNAVKSARDISTFMNTTEVLEGEFDMKPGATAYISMDMNHVFK